jgi:hypothetical protein
MLEYRKEDEARWQRFDKEFRETNKQLGGLHSSLGELTEAIFASRLWEKFDKEPYKYDLRESLRGVIICDPKDGRHLTEVDILLVGKEYAVVVEVKRVLTPGEIVKHTRRMQYVRKYPPKEAVGKTLLGAIAAGSISSNEDRQIVYDSGFFLFELTGELVELVVPKEDFIPVEWN